MNANQLYSLRNTIERLCVWTLRNHDFLIAKLRVYVWAVTATVLFFAIANRIHLSAALVGIFLGGVCLYGLLWFLVQYRRVVLLRIEDPVLREKAYEAMLYLIHKRKKRIEGQENFWHRIVSLFYAR